MSHPVWLSSLPNDIAVTAEAWLNVNQNLPSSIMGLLDSLHERHAPFLLSFVVHLMQISPETLEKRTPLLLQICKVWLKAWEQQGSPESLDDFLLIGNWGSKGLKQLSLTIAYTLDRALANHEAPKSISEFTCMLLGSRYKSHLGWYNLRGYPEPLVRILMQRAGAIDPMSVSADRISLVTHLSKQAGQPWAKYLMCVAIALVGELQISGGARRGAISDRSYLNRATTILTVIHHNRGLNIDNRHVASLLEAYIEGKLIIPRNSKRSTRASMVQTFLSCIASQQRYLRQFPEHDHYLAPYVLPRPTRPVVGLSLTDICAETKQRRQADVHAIHPDLYQWLSLAEIRRNVARLICTKMHTTSHDCKTFDVPLPDSSAVLKFRFVSISDVQEQSKQRAPTQTRLIEYLGHEGPERISGKQPFFVFLHRAYFNRQFLSRLMKLGYYRQDFRGYSSGILKPIGAHHDFCQKMMDHDVATGSELRTYIEADTLAFAMSAACLEIELILSTGMRVHELQQIRVDIDSTYPGSDVPVLYMDDSSIYVLIYPKGHKPAQNHLPVQYSFPSDIKDSWIIMREHHQLIWGPERYVDFENGAEFGIPPAPFLFQAHGKIITTHALRMLLPNILIGHKAIREDNLLASVKPHVFRALNMNEMKASGLSLYDISRNMHGGNQSMTQHYLTDLLPERYNLEHVSYWDALCADFPE